MHVHRVCLSLHLIKKTEKEKNIPEDSCLSERTERANGKRKRIRREIRAGEEISVANCIIAVAYAM